MTQNSPIDARIKEAEIYNSQGLFDEALALYEGIIEQFPDIPSQKRQQIDHAVAGIRTEIEGLAQEDPQLTSEDISLIQESWEGEDNVPEILDGASAFMELGLFKEAADEYRKLLDFDFPITDIVPKLAECLFQIHSPARVIDQIEKIIKEKKIEGGDKTTVNFLFGLEMENREYPDLAYEIYQTVAKLDPDYHGIKEKIKQLQGARIYDSKYGYLLEKDIVNTSQLQNALGRSKKMKKSVEFILTEQLRIKKEDIGKSLSLFYKCPFSEFDESREIPYELLTRLKKTFLIQNSWVPLSWDISERVVDIFIDDPRDLTKTDPIPGLFNVPKINYFVGIREDIVDTINLFFEGKNEAATEMAEEDDGQFDMMDIDFEEEEDEEEVGDEHDEASGQVVKMVDQILITAYRKDASDIHIEPSPISKNTGIRYRIDGVCQEITQFPNSLTRGIMSRLKIMSNLDIAERRLPQDGKIKFKRKGLKPFELRLATLPTAGGFEDAVLRILAESGAMSLDDMGMNERNLGIMKKIINQPYGLVLVVGPTGSGKTTTLHASLGYINKPGIKIWTAEDPVEITQPGLRQVECQPKIGLDFARVMRAFLRADPDVIMIGEMRDHETASIGVEASLTGHLVFSTLHTNSAPETVTRLLDMGLNALNFSDAFLGVLAQRLARRLCKSCREEYNPSQEEFDEIVKDYEPEAFKATGIELTPELTIYKTVGCEACSDTGYKGRLGIHEMMEGTKTIKGLIKREATSEELFKQSAEEGMTTIKQDGIRNVFLGITDINEIRRVCIE